MPDINKLAKDIHNSNIDAGWWDDYDRCFYTTMQLVSTEIAEATEGDRKGLMDDHLSHRNMEEVELADVLIRIFDLAGRYGWTYKSDIPYACELDNDDVNNQAAYHCICNISASTLTQLWIGRANKKTMSYAYSEFVNSVLETAKRGGHDVMGALMEKWEYNKHRADHKRENRAKEGGKKY